MESCNCYQGEKKLKLKNTLFLFCILIWIIIAVFALVLVSLAAPVTQGENHDVVSVFTTIAPLEWFINSIAGDTAAISILVPAGVDAHVYEPKPEQMAELSKAEIYFAIGNFSPFEASSLPKIAEQTPSLMIVRLNEEIEEWHGDDPHIWTSVFSAPAILKNVRKAFVAVNPQNADMYNKNYIHALEKIKELDAHIKDKYQDSGGKSFIVYHPVWGRFAMEYGINQIAIEHEGKEPKINALARLIETAREKEIKTIFAAPSDPKRNYLILADQIGADVVMLDPLASDWLQNMYSVTEEIYKALR